MMEANNDVSIFVQGCENSDSQYCFSSRRRFRLALFLLIGIVCSRHREADDCDIVFLFGKLHEKILGDSVSAIHHAASALPIKRMRANASIFSDFRFSERVLLLIDALKKAKSVGASKDKARYIEYRFLAKTIEKRSEHQYGETLRVTTASMTDRYVTWISGLCKSKDLALNVYQHGTLLHFKGMPHRITVSNFCVYNEREQRCIEEFIVANADCNYTIVPFKSNVAFSSIEDKGDLYHVGIISQHNKKFNQDAVAAVSELYPKARIMLMLHPAEEFDAFYRKLKHDNRQLDIFEHEKFIDVDMLVLNNSTMIYDYVYSGYKSAIVVISEERLYGFLTTEIQYYDSFQCWVDEVRND